MLVQNSVYRNTYLTDGVNKDFYFSFPILETSQVLVQTCLLTDTDTAITVDPGQYTVTGVGQATGGHISFTTAPPIGSRIALTLNMPITQLYQYAELDSFPAKSHENALAKLTLICQQLKEQISRAVLISATSEGSTADIIASLYAARDSATASAELAVAEAAAATLAATNAEQAATDAAQAAADAAANSSGLATEVQNWSAMFIGAVFPLTCSDTYVPNGCVPANGGEYTRSQFPRLYDTYLVGGKLLTCTYTEWSTQVGLTGNCAKFAVDTVNQKFKVPLIKDGDSITHAASAAELGKSVKAGLPNITGKQRPSLGPGAGDTTGAFVLVASSGHTTSSGADGTVFNTVDFDASKSNAIYGNSTTVTDEQVRLRHFVVVASAQNNASVFDWSAYMAGLAGKLNSDGTNADLTKCNVVLQQVRYTAGAFASSTATLPSDGTIPQISEGTQFMAATITPKRATSRIVVEVTVNGNGDNSYWGSALFKNGAADAVAAGGGGGNTYSMQPCQIYYEYGPGTTDAQTFTVRAGTNNGYTFRFNAHGNGTVAASFGGVPTSHITITEYAA